MAYLALARKYRPQTFSEVLSQDFIMSTLQNAIKLNRVSHAYLFTGPRGVGKTSTARIFAKALNCLEPQDAAPCGSCENCLEIVNGLSLDVIEIDGASNRGVEEIRSLREAVKFVPVKSKYKIVIVDEVHMLTEPAFNALLKTLEEPPEFVIFIFATTDQHKIPATIISRCQRYEFKKISYDEMLFNLKTILDKEKIEYEEDGLNFVIRNSDGCMRDALSILDQVIAYSDGKISYKETALLLGMQDSGIIDNLFAAMIKEEPLELPKLIEQLEERGLDYKFSTEQLIERCRNMLFFVSTGNLPRQDFSKEEIDYYISLKDNTSVTYLYSMFQILQKLAGDLKYCDFVRYMFEFAVFKAASLSSIIKAGSNIGSLQNTSVNNNRTNEYNNKSYNKAEDTGYKNIDNSVNDNKYSNKSVDSDTVLENTNKDTDNSESNDTSSNKQVSIWSKTLERIAKKDSIMSENLKYVKVLLETKEKVSIEFPATRGFFYKYLVQGKRREDFLIYLRDVTGYDTKLDVRLEEYDSNKDKKKVDNVNESTQAVTSSAIPENYNLRQKKNQLQGLTLEFVEEVAYQLGGEIENIEEN